MSIDYKIAALDIKREKIKFLSQIHQNERRNVQSIGRGRESRYKLLARIIEKTAECGISTKDGFQDIVMLQNGKVLIAGRK